MFLRKVLTLFSVEKHLSASAVVMGVVMMIFSSVTVSENTSDRLFSMNNWKRTTTGSEFVCAIDEAKLCLQLTSIEHWIGLQCGGQSNFREYIEVVFKLGAIQ